MSGLTVKDLEEIQTLLPDYQMELVDGEVRVMSPSGYESDEVAARVVGKLFNWVDSRRLGRVTASGAGFVLPNSNTRAPDVSFVTAERLRRAPRRFAQLAPDLMVEVKSPDDTLKGLPEAAPATSLSKLKKLHDKIDEFLKQGTQVGVLIHPEQRWISIHRSGQEPVTLRDGDVLTFPDLLPGWEVPVSELWSPVFEEE